MPRRWWVTGFLGITGVVVTAELWAAWDGSPETVPWTDLIVEYIPGEVTAAGIGALLLWLPVHFGIRYWRRSRDRGPEPPRLPLLNYMCPHPTAGVSSEWLALAVAGARMLLPGEVTSDRV